MYLLHSEEFFQLDPPLDFAYLLGSDDVLNDDLPSDFFLALLYLLDCDFESSFLNVEGVRLYCELFFNNLEFVEFLSFELFEIKQDRDFSSSSGIFIVLCYPYSKKTVKTK
ncbi:hypothetical protein ACKWTF_007030 [Chironomus riparius]